MSINLTSFSPSLLSKLWKRGSVETASPVGAGVYATGKHSPVDRVTAIDISDLTTEHEIAAAMPPVVPEKIRLYRRIGDPYVHGRNGSNYFSRELSIALDHGAGESPHMLIIDIKSDWLFDLHAYRKLEAAVGKRLLGMSEFNAFSTIEIPDDWISGPVNRRVLSDIKGLSDKYDQVQTIGEVDTKTFDSWLRARANAEQGSLERATAHGKIINYINRNQQAFVDLGRTLPSLFKPDVLSRVIRWGSRQASRLTL